MEAVKKQKKISEANRLTAVSPWAQAAIRIIIGLFVICCLIPFLFVIIISFTSEKSIQEFGYSFFPKAWSLDAYTSIVEIVGNQLWVSFFNSVLVTVVGTVLSVLICVLYSYALFRRDFKLRGFFAFFCFFTMLFGGGLAPTYTICQMLGMGDNYAALIIPLLVNPFNFIVMRTFFQTSLPFEILEAAQVDGCSEWGTLFRIAIPISKPGIATIALLNMLVYWNDWFLAQLYLKSEKFVTLQYLLVKMQLNVQYMAQNSGKDPTQLANLPTLGIRMALCVIIVIPIAFAYPFFQRYIVKGLTVGAVKG